MTDEITSDGAVRVAVAVVERARADARGKGHHDFEHPEVEQRRAQRWCDRVGIPWREEDG